MKLLRILNRQKIRAVDTAFLKRATVSLLQDLFQLRDYELAIHLVDPDEMTKVNESFLGHEGSTDVITFDNSEGLGACLNGEIFISVADAIAYAKTFRSTWQSEVARYVVHGILHLRGFDDLEPGLRRVMKREENRFLKALAEKFDLEKMQRSGRVLPARRVNARNIANETK